MRNAAIDGVFIVGWSSIITHTQSQAAAQAIQPEGVTSCMPNACMPRGGNRLSLACLPHPVAVARTSSYSHVM